MTKKDVNKEIIWFSIGMILGAIISSFFLPLPHVFSGFFHMMLGVL